MLINCSIDKVKYNNFHTEATDQKYYRVQLNLILTKLSHRQQNHNPNYDQNQKTIKQLKPVNYLTLMLTKGCSLLALG